MKKTFSILLLAVVLGTFAYADDEGGNASEKGKITGVIARDPDKQIKALNIMPASNAEELDNDEHNPRFFLEGEFHRENWQLFIGRRHITLTPQGTFQIGLPVRAEKFALVFTGRGPNGEMERERVEIRILDWEIVRKKIVAAKSNKTEAPAPGSYVEASHRLLDFRLFSLFATQDLPGLTSSSGLDLGAYSYTAGVSWNPALRLFRGFFLMGDIAVEPLKKLTGGLFPATAYTLFISYPEFWFFHLEVGYGAQTWIGYGGTRMVVAGNAVIRTNALIVPGVKISNIFGGYHYVTDDTHARQIRLGITLSF